MQTEYIIAICIVFSIIIIAIYTSNLIVIPFGICIIALLSAGLINSHMAYNRSQPRVINTSGGYDSTHTAHQRTKKPINIEYQRTKKPMNIEYQRTKNSTTLDNWIDLFELLFTQNYPHVVPKAFKITKNRINYSNPDAEYHDRLGDKWIFEESSRPSDRKKLIVSACKINPILQNYIRDNPKGTAILYQKVENIRESLSFIYTITVHNRVISSTISSNTKIPDTVINIMKSMSIIVDTCISVPSEPMHKDIIKCYKINMIRLNNTIDNFKNYTEQIFQNYTEYIITDWIPLNTFIPDGSESHGDIIPINTIPAPNDYPTYTFDVERLNQRDFLVYTIKNKWRRVDINAAKLLKRPVDLHFYLSANSSYNNAIKNMPARVQGRLDVIALSNKAKLHQLIINTPHLLNYIPESIIIHHQKTDPDNKNVKVVPTPTEPWIWRPEFGCSGWGIEVITSKEKLDAVIDKYEYLGEKYRFVLSRYIINPKLIKNPDNNQLYKFHIRLWAIVSIDKYDIKRFALFNTGNIITSGAPYINSDYNNKKIHDTHQGKSLQIAEGSFPQDFPGTDEEKSKLFVDIHKMFADIFEAVSHKVEKMDKCESGFQIFGIDMMVTDQNKPVLLEINNQPGLPGYHKYHPGYVTRLSKEFYSALWDTVINPLVTDAPIVKDHKNITLLYTSN